MPAPSSSARPSTRRAWTPGHAGLAAGGDRAVARPDRRARPTQSIISSGSAISADAYRVLGAFREDYFIECVDIEYGLRAWSRGVPVYMTSRATLRQIDGRHHPARPVLHHQPRGVAALLQRAQHGACHADVSATATRPDAPRAGDAGSGAPRGPVREREAAQADGDRCGAGSTVRGAARHGSTSGIRGLMRSAGVRGAGPDGWFACSPVTTCSATRQPGLLGPRPLSSDGPLLPSRRSARS